MRVCERRAGDAFFDSMAKDPAAARTFSRAMTSFLQSIPASVVEVYDFSGYERIVDVGSAHGTLMTAVLNANPRPRVGVLFSPPRPAARRRQGARQPMAAAGLADRCDFVGGDFLSAVPRGGDLYILSTILHDWDDERSVEILRNCREAMTRRGKLILVEMVIGEGNEPFFGKWLDLHMLVMHGGRDRTAARRGCLLRAGGFRLERIYRAGSCGACWRPLPRWASPREEKATVLPAEVIRRRSSRKTPAFNTVLLGPFRDEEGVWGEERGLTLLVREGV